MKEFSNITPHALSQMAEQIANMEFTGLCNQISELGLYFHDGVLCAKEKKTGDAIYYAYDHERGLFEKVAGRSKASTAAQVLDALRSDQSALSLLGIGEKTKGLYDGQSALRDSKSLREHKVSPSEAKRFSGSDREGDESGDINNLKQEIEQLKKNLEDERAGQEKLVEKHGKAWREQDDSAAKIEQRDNEIEELKSEIARLKNNQGGGMVRHDKNMASQLTSAQQEVEELSKANNKLDEQLRELQKNHKEEIESLHRGYAIKSKKGEGQGVGSNKDADKKIKELQDQVEELTTRLSKFAAKQLTEGNPNIADLSDNHRPTKIGENFEKIYDDQWSDAFEVLKEQGKNETEAVKNLVAILKNTEQHMESYISDRKDRFAEFLGIDKREGNVINALILDAEKKSDGKHLEQYIMAKVVPVICEELKLPDDKHGHVKAYIKALCGCLYKAKVQNPPMCLVYQKEHDKVALAQFKCYEKQGNNVDFTVWPALLLHKNGPLVAKGYVKPR